MKTITVQLPLQFDSDHISLNEVDFNIIQSKLEQNQTIHKDPVLFKVENGVLMITYLVVDKSGSAGFHAQKNR
jgi:hypothetical protein